MGNINKKTRAIQTRINQAQYNALEEYTRRQHRTISSFLRMLVIKELNRDIQTGVENQSQDFQQTE